MLLNIDLGELPDEDDELYAHAHLANVACGGHAGDEASMRRAVRLCPRTAPSSGRTRRTRTARASATADGHGGGGRCGPR